MLLFIPGPFTYTRKFIIMKYILILLLLITSTKTIAGISDTNIVYTCKSWLYGTNYISSITGSQILRCPEWNSDKSEPPLNVKRAISAARKELATIVKDEKQWFINEVEVIKIPMLQDEILPTYKNRWIYKVYCMPPMTGSGYGTVIPCIAVVVLMDGTAVHPKSEESSYPS